MLGGHGFPPDRLYTVVDGIDTERFRPFDGSPAWEAERRRLRAELGIPEGRKIVAYVGVLAPYQGNTPSTTASPSMTNCCSRFFSAALTIQGKRLVQS